MRIPQNEGLGAGFVASMFRCRGRLQSNGKVRYGKITALP